MAKMNSSKVFVVGPPIGVFKEVAVSYKKGGALEMIRGLLGCKGEVTSYRANYKEKEYEVWVSDECFFDMELALNEWFVMPCMRGPAVITNDAADFSPEAVHSVVNQVRRQQLGDLQLPAFQMYDLSGNLVSSVKETILSSVQETYGRVLAHYAAPDVGSGRWSFILGKNK